MSADGQHEEDVQRLVYHELPLLFCLALAWLRGRGFRLFGTLTLWNLRCRAQISPGRVRWLLNWRIFLGGLRGFGGRAVFKPLGVSVAQTMIVVQRHMRLAAELVEGEGDADCSF